MPQRMYTPEDKDQSIVLTPYGRGLVIRSNRDDSIREIQLTEWQMTSSRQGVSPFAMLYSCQSFPSVRPLKGDHVTCLWGRGVIQDLRRDGMVVVRLSSWRLANRSFVMCFLDISAIKVVRKKTKSEMDVYERVELAEEFKALANKQFAQKLYEPAVVTYSKAVDAVRYVQHDSNSSNEVRADLIVVMITCSNNAGTCSIHLHKWDQAIKFAKNALLLIDALYPKRGSRIHKILNKDGYADSKIFGEWRVKSYLLMARAHFERKDYDLALETLQETATILEQHNEKTATLLSQEKEAKKLRAHCHREEKAVKKMERKRAQAMFGGGSSSAAKSTEKATNGAELDGASSTLEGAKMPSAPSEHTVLKVDDLTGSSEAKSERRDTDQTLSTKKVTFILPEDEEAEHEDEPWYYEHMEAFILTSAVGLAIGISYLLSSRRKQ